MGASSLPNLVFHNFVVVFLISIKIRQLKNSHLHFLHRRDKEGWRGGGGGRRDSSDCDYNSQELNSAWLEECWEL